MPNMQNADTTTVHKIEKGISKNYLPISKPLGQTSAFPSTLKESLAKIPYHFSNTQAKRLNAIYPGFWPVTCEFGNPWILRKKE